MPYHIQDLEIFSLSVGCLFTFWHTNAFESQEFSILMKFNIPIFSLSLVLLALYPSHRHHKERKEPHAQPRSWRLAPMFYSRSFVVLALTCRCVIHSETVFVCCDVEVLVHFFHVYIQFQQRLLKGLFIPPFNCLGTMSKNNWPKNPTKKQKTPKPNWP